MFPTRCNRWLLSLGFLLIPVICQAADPPKEFTNSIGMKLTLIPAGEFMMGSAMSVSELSRVVMIRAGVDRAMRKEHPQHRVSITQPYYLSITEVTQGQWERVMDSRPWSKRPRVKEGANFPVTWVSWDDAREFCSRLSQEDGRNYRLPTEAEWEYACRAQTTTIFSFGDDVIDLLDYGWFEDNAHKQNEDYAHRVARQKANRWGLCDMHGNVWEWCSDWYGADYYAKSPSEDPKGPIAGSERVIRSGSWRNSANHSRSAFRFGCEPTSSSDDIGFRVVAEIRGRGD